VSVEVFDDAAGDALLVLGVGVVDNELAASMPMPKLP
jgi:hypothetical protein